MSQNKRGGEIIIENTNRIVVRGHFSPEEMQRRTGFTGSVQQTYFRHAYTPWRQKQLFEAPRSKYVRARRKGRGAFAVTVLYLEHETQ